MYYANLLPPDTAELESVEKSYQFYRTVCDRRRELKNRPSAAP